MIFTAVFEANKLARNPVMAVSIELGVPSQSSVLEQWLSISATVISSNAHS